MWWGNYSLMWQLAKLIPKPKRRAGGSATTASSGAVARFGSCPACHEFVQVKPWGPSGSAVCPNCGRLVRSLDALGSERSSTDSDER